MQAVAVGLLPLYLKLYDDTSPEHRAGVERFCDVIAAELRTRGFDVVAAPVCRIESEFKSAIDLFQVQKVAAIVTLHLAYSPSLESVPTIAGCDLPVIVLDTTPTYDFSPRQSQDEIMYNHGIHGVQDFCNLLIRYGKRFHIEAGHWQHSDVLDRVAKLVKGAALSKAIRSARIGRIGKGFLGMADFDVPVGVMAHTIGITTVPISPEVFGAMTGRISEVEIDLAVALDCAAYQIDDVKPEVHALAARVGLAVRRWVSQERLTGFTVNFMEATRGNGVPAMPFLEASKMMGRGLGYAGEGDVLTAALVGALGSVYSHVTFAEMFCPDWANESIFLSHMGEMNINLIEGTPRLVQKQYAFIDSADPVMAIGRFKAGHGVWVNLAPGPADSFVLILAAVEVLSVQGEDAMADTIHGWIRPASSVSDFLTAYSRSGGTHHAALVYGDVLDEIRAFGDMMSWKTVIL